MQHGGSILRILLVVFADVFPMTQYTQYIDVNCLIILKLLTHGLLKTLQISAQLEMDQLSW